MRARGSYKKSRLSRQQVLEAAVKVLAERGFAHTSVNDIAAAAGMSKGAVHYHFENKDDLINQVLERCAETMRQRVRDAFDAPVEPTEKIRRALREMRHSRQDAAPELRVMADLMAQGLHDPALRARIARMFEANRKEVVEQVVGSLAELGLEPKIPLHVLPRLMLGALDGLALHDFFDPPGEGEDEEVQKALEEITLSLIEPKR